MSGEDFDLDLMTAEAITQEMSKTLVMWREKYGFTALVLVGSRLEANVTRHFDLAVGDFYAGYGAMKMRIIGAEAKKREEVNVK